MADLEDLFHQISDDKEARSGPQRFIQRTLGAVSGVYGAGAWFSRAVHESGIRRESLPAVVLSVGNITLGGTGKTPFCIWLTQYLQEIGRKPMILARGYGRADEDSLTLVHDGKRIRSSTAKGGDEPVLLARVLADVPVIACSDRVRGGKAGLKRFDADTIILDDGFQHHRLNRNGDIVLVDSTKPLSGLRIVPRGTLREPLSALGRAHLIVMTRWDQAKHPKRAYRDIRREAPSVPVVRTRFVVDSLLRPSTKEKLFPESIEGRRVCVLCGVGNPHSVRQTVEGLGAKIAGLHQRSDHVRYSRNDVGAMERWRRRRKADYLVTTEKDAVKLAEIGPLPENLLVLRLRVEFLSRRDRKIAEQVIKARLESRLVRGYLR